MIREGATYDELVVEAIRRIRGASSPSVVRKNSPLIRALLSGRSVARNSPDKQFREARPCAPRRRRAFARAVRSRQRGRGARLARLERRRRAAAAARHV